MNTVIARLFFMGGVALLAVAAFEILLNATAFNSSMKRWLVFIECSGRYGVCRVLANIVLDDQIPSVSVV